MNRAFCAYQLRNNISVSNFAEKSTVALYANFAKKQIEILRKTVS
jgi:hypothetical protein